MGVGVLLLAIVVGAGVLAGGEAAGTARSLDQQVADRRQQVAALDANRKSREASLAELTRKLSAKEAELAEASERVAALERRRATLQAQVADLTAPISPDASERAIDGSEREPTPAPTIAAAPPLPRSRDEGVAASSASVDEAPGDDDVRLARATLTAGSEAVERSTAFERNLQETERSTPRATASATRVFIHVRAGDAEAQARARAVAMELKRRGVSFVEIRGVRLPVRRDAVRYFYDADRSALSTLQDVVRQTDGADPVTQDFRSFGAPPRQGTIELWLS